MKKKVYLALRLLPMLLLTATVNYAADGKGLKAEGPMTNAQLEAILKTVEPNVKGANGRWEMVRDGVPVMVLTDESHNRMRVIAPAAELKELNQQALMRMMEANFARALDARYAVSQGIVWAAFIHPLNSLRERDFISGLQQIITLVKTTGTTYSSSDLQFSPAY